jgi:hypothetical protein
LTAAGAKGRSFDLRLSGRNINSDHVQVVASARALLGIMVRNKSGVIIKGCIALAAGTIKDDEQPSSFLSMRDRTKSMMAMRCPG